MPNPGDDPFEFELKQFRPIAPEPFSVQKVSRALGPRLARMASLAAAAILAVVAWLALPHRSPPVPANGGVALLGNTQSLTLGPTNARLAAAPSYKAALDSMAFPTQPAPVAPDKRSAIAELSKERIKL